MKNMLETRETEDVSIAFLYKSQGKYDQLDVGMYWRKNAIVLGVWYRGLPVKRNDYAVLNNDAIIMLVGYKFPKYRVGYSYDFTVSRLISSSGGAHEFSVIYEFNKNNDMPTKVRKYYSCPEF